MIESAGAGAAAPGPNPMREKGAYHPGWVVVAVITCVLVGSTLNQCLTCFHPPEPVAMAAAVPVRGAPIDAPAAPEVEEEDVDALEDEDEEGVADAIPVPKGRPLRELKEPETPKELASHEDMTFDKLASYPYEFEEVGQEFRPKANQIPEGIQKFDGKKISIKGFMIPLRNDGESVVEFVLVRNQGWCCFGQVPRMNEWIHVKMEQGKAAPYALDIPLTVFGTLGVGEIYENGALMSVYRMDAVHVIEPPLFR